MQTAAQIIGIIGSALMIFSFQLHDNKKLFFVHTLAGLCFTVNFTMIGAYAAALLNIIGAVRTAFLYFGDKFRKLYILLIICLGFAAVTVFTYSRPFDIAICIAQIAITCAMWTNNGKTIRIVQLFFTSPIWLAYNITVFTIGGIICESFNMCSVIVSFIRFRKKGF